MSQDFLKKAQELQKQMLSIQNDLSEMVVVGESGGGLVKVEIRASDNNALKFEVSKDVVDDDILLSDLLVAAVNNAIKNAEDIRQEKIRSVQHLFPDSSNL
ncbi:YbaB/EbfC family nucleoid-associated protein [Candidatus Gromoviella agglomerans]|uniref:YbaB/EbfC family nucleoid-associated protein n=1 Tax=Candidatus Gromoviella agglomerans TaxID=2806609 RepID=UPI001E459C42|nr:YbaB/EbfC family nucleoid-associated protein [Candidatus Gromoviella agglomerans]UFX98212.1 YbaB/EbfC family nucleoid-associated protein [Candidatus Gromoviella agglomerans]